MKDLSRFTHVAKLYGFKCYFNIETSELKGTNYLNDLLIDIAILFDQKFGDSEGFAIELISEI